jgi:hypothetical protein
MDAGGGGVTELRWAVAYARRGWSVIPLHTPGETGCSCGRPACAAVGKHPRLSWEAAMSRRAAESEVIAWWRRWPEANIGVVTGRVSGLAVLDIDPRHDGRATLEALEVAHGPLPATLEVATGGGGSHLWYAAGPETVPSAVLGPGVELKAEGGLVVVPPSLHRSGRRYAWVPGRSPADGDPAPLPAWLGAARPPWVRPGGQAAPAPPRTEGERRAFAAAWARAGVRVEPGEGYYSCPFHPDEHPSLHVDEAGCRWFCFGCRRGGGTGRLLELLGERPAADPRRRLRAFVGSRLPVTVDGSSALDIVGESHHQDELLELVGRRRPYGGVELTAVAELVPEPDNPADPAAIVVTIDGRAVGYLGREDARRLRDVVVGARRARGRATARAIIRGGWDRGRSDVGSLGVVLLLPGPLPGRAERPARRAPLRRRARPLR